MLEDVRRTLSQRREAVRQGQLKGIEKERRLSYIRTQRLKERKAAEEELQSQASTELSAHDAARRAYRERRMMEKELRTARTPDAATKLARGARRAAKVAFHTGPIRTVRAVRKAQRSGKLNLNKVLIGDTRLLVGRGSDEPLEDFIFGKRAPTPKGRGKSPGILDIDRDILR